MGGNGPTDILRENCTYFTYMYINILGEYKRDLLIYRNVLAENDTHLLDKLKASVDLFKLPCTRI